MEKLLDFLFLGGNFRLAFWSSLFATLIAGAILGAIAYFKTNLFRTPEPNLLMVVKQDGGYSERITFRKQADGSYRADFQLAIKNKGDRAFKVKEGFWHTYIHPLSPQAPVAHTAPGEVNHQRGEISYTIYPDYIVDIDDAFYYLTIKEGETPAKGVHYFFVTDYGFFPREVKFDSTVGAVDPGSLALLEFEFIQ